MLRKEIKELCCSSMLVRDVLERCSLPIDYFLFFFFFEFGNYFITSNIFFFFLFNFSMFSFFVTELLLFSSDRGFFILFERRYYKDGSFYSFLTSILFISNHFMPFFISNRMSERNSIYDIVFSYDIFYWDRSDCVFLFDDVFFFKDDIEELLFQVQIYPIDFFFGKDWIILLLGKFISFSFFKELLVSLTTINHLYLYRNLSVFIFSFIELFFFFYKYVLSVVLILLSINCVFCLDEYSVLC